MHYLKLLKEKDVNAREKLINHNLRLVAHIVKKFENYKEEKDDLLSIGSIGLIKAIDTYKLESDVKLATYAAKCIENEILMYLRNNKKRRNTTSIYSPIGQDKEGNEIRIIDVVEDNQIETIDKIINEENIRQINEALKILSKRELSIITKRFGLNGAVVQTQKEISDEMKISRSYVSRIEKRALTKLYLYIINKNR